MIDTLREADRTSVMWGDVDTLDDCASRAGIGKMHPLRRHKRVLDALTRNARSQKPLFRTAKVRLDVWGDHGGVRRVRSFFPILESKTP